MGSSQPHCKSLQLLDFQSIKQVYSKYITTIEQLNFESCKPKSTIKNNISKNKN